MAQLNSSYFFQQAVALRDRIVAGQINETPVMAWAAVARACANASNAKQHELDGMGAYTRLELNWFNNLDRIWWIAKAQVETLTGSGR